MHCKYFSHNINHLADLFLSELPGGSRAPGWELVLFFHSHTHTFVDTRKCLHRCFYLMTTWEHFYMLIHKQTLSYASNEQPISSSPLSLIRRLSQHGTPDCHAVSNLDSSKHHSSSLCVNTHATCAYPDVCMSVHMLGKCEDLRG